MPDPVDVGAQSDLFGATAPAVARPPITEQNGGSRSRWDRGASPTSIDRIVCNGILSGGRWPPDRACPS
jgi:hypothetical protein